MEMYIQVFFHAMLQNKNNTIFQPPQPSTLETKNDNNINTLPHGPPATINTVHQHMHQHSNFQHKLQSLSVRF